MDNILIEVYLPAVEKSFDIIVPRNGMMWEVTKLVSTALEELSDGVYKASEETVLCDKATGTIFNINLSIEELGLTNGAQLILI